MSPRYDDITGRRRPFLDDVAAPCDVCGRERRFASTGLEHIHNGSTECSPEDIPDVSITVEFTHRYDRPGACAKCGAGASGDVPGVIGLKWVPGYIYFDGDVTEDSGKLFAVCNRCRYEWRVAAKDELEEATE